MRNIAKLYVIVRTDLNPGQIISQSVHAASEFILRGEKDLVSLWDNGHIVILGVDDEEELHSYMRQMSERDIEFKEFKEPYYKDSVTGFSTVRFDKEELFKGLQLLTF